MGVYLRVDEPVAVTWVSLNYSTYNLSAWQTLQLVATVRPDNASNKNVIWSSGGWWAATVDQNWLVTCTSAWSTWTITVTTEDGWYTATCLIYRWK